MEFTFIAVPGFATALGLLIEGTIANFFGTFPGLGPLVAVFRVLVPKYLYYTIERDGNDWRVTVEIAEEPEREESGIVDNGQVQTAQVRKGVGVLPFATIIALAIAISIITFGGAVAFRITKGDWGPGGVLAWGPLILLFGLGVVAIGMFRRNTSQLFGGES